MSSSRDSSDSEWSGFTTSLDHKKETKPKPIIIINGDKKSYRQKFVECWLDRFQPWLAKDETSHKPYCKACKRLLGTKCSHLKRHERTTKHKRNLQTYLRANGLLPDRQNLGQRKERKNSNKVDQSKFESIFMDTGETILDCASHTQETLQELPFKTENVSQASASYQKDHDAKKQTKRKGTNHKTGTTRSGKQLFFQIQKDRHELMASFNELMAIEKKDKNNVDLFFEGIISSVKALSPKLIVETKMRICQLICEMELRTITENESKSQDPTMLMSVPLTNELVIQHQGDTASEINQKDSSQDEFSLHVAE